MVETVPAFDFKNPNYSAVLEKRYKLLYLNRKNPASWEGAKAVYRENWDLFIEHWGWTYDPRRQPAEIPMILFPRQREYVRWLMEHYRGNKDGAVLKSRDMGLTWLNIACAVAMFLFIPGSKVAFGSRKEDLVDKLGDMDSILEKGRFFMRHLPYELMPDAFFDKTAGKYLVDKHCGFMRFLNPETGSSITGEAGDNIGRGGRSQPLDAKILTPDGWTSMRDVRVGNFVMGGDGLPVRVTGVFPQGVEPIYRVDFTDNTSTECGGSHLWQVTTPAIRKSLRRADKARPDQHCQRHASSVDFLVLKTHEMLDSVLVKRSAQTEYRYHIPLAPCAQFAATDLPLDPYVLGALLGDGSISNIDKSCVGFTSADPEIVEIISANLPEHCQITPNGGLYAYVVTDVRGARGRGYRNPVKSALIDLGLAGTKSHTKFIPDSYKRSSISERLELLRGLMDTDGWLARPTKPCYCTTSQQLADDVVEIVQSLGGVATIQKRLGSLQKLPQGSQCVGRDSYNVIICLPSGLNPFRLKRKASRYADKMKYGPRRAIKNIEYVGHKETQCITVDSDDGLYLTNDFIVTHNSSVYILDEAAYLERPELIDAALSMNSNCKIHVSTPNGTGNPFWKKCTNFPPEDVIVLNWRDDPRKDDEWYRKQCLTLDPWVVAQEIDHDFDASVENVAIPAKWVRSAIGLKLEPSGVKQAGFDASDEGNDPKAYVQRYGSVVEVVLDWKEGDIATGTRKAWAMARSNGVELLCYDNIGIGAGAKVEFDHLRSRSERVGIAIQGIGSEKMTGTYEGNKLNKDMFHNYRAMGWWNLRRRFERTHQHVTGVRQWDADDMISIPHDGGLISELSRPTFNIRSNGKLAIESKDDMRKRGIPSPNKADALILAFTPSSVARSGRFGMDWRGGRGASLWPSQARVNEPSEELEAVAV